MLTTIKAPGHFRFYAAALALAALVITLLAMSVAGNPAQAQTSDANNNYPDPKPCGPGAGEAFQPEPHEITEGHYALFDAYWERRGENLAEGVLHTNLCPPIVSEVVQVDPETEEEAVTIVRSTSNIDIGEAIFHVKDVYQTTVVATNAGAKSGRLSLEEYLDIEEAASAGSKVWWLQLDDPDTTNVDETSDLSLGFSAALLDDDYWFTKAEGKPMRYKFEVERYPGSDPANVPHFFAFEAPKDDNEAQRPVWDSTRPDIDDDDMILDPGEFRALQWVFTRAGTYELWVHIQGYVRDSQPAGTGEGWKAVSDNETETSEIRKYVIQVGDTLDEMEPPLFGVNFNVDENSPAGTKVGSPILVYQTEAMDLEYQLAGKGHKNFTLVSATDPHSVQIVVNDGADLDYEKKTSYDLRLSVSDNIDHESNPDSTVDDVLAIEIDINDIVPALSMTISDSTPQVGDTVVFTATLTDIPANGQRRSISFDLNKRDEFGNITYEQGTLDPQTLVGNITTSENYAHSVDYWATVAVLVQTSQSAGSVNYGTQPVTLTWTE